jgi:hypothetical protein
MDEHHDEMERVRLRRTYGVGTSALVWSAAAGRELNV